MIYQLSNSSGILSFNHIAYKNINLRSHFHRNIEFVYVEKGEVEITVNNIVQTAREGDFAIVLPYHIHSFHTPADSDTVVGVFSNDFAGKFTGDTSNKTTSSFVFKADDNTAESFCNIKRLNNLRIMGIIYTLCGFFCEQTDFIEYNSKNDVMLKRILMHISNHLSENITLQSVAESLG